MALAARPGPAAEILTLSEASRLAGVDRETVRAWCDRGDLKVVRGTGRQIRLLRRDLERLLNARGRPASAGRGHAGDRRARAAELATAAAAPARNGAARNGTAAESRRGLAPGTDAL